MKLLSELSILALLATAVATGTEPAPRPAAPPVRPTDGAASATEKPAASSERTAETPRKEDGTRAACAVAPSSSSSSSLSAPSALLLGGEWGDLVERPARAQRRRLTPQEIEIFVEVSKDAIPYLGEQVEDLCRRDPETCEKNLLQSDRLIRLVELRERDKNLYDKKILAMRADAEVDRLARELRAVRKVGRKADEEALRERLRFYVRLQVGLGHDARREYLCQLRDLVEQLEKELEREKEHLAAHPDEVVEERIEALLRDGDAATLVEPAASPPE